MFYIRKSFQILFIIQLTIILVLSVVFIDYNTRSVVALTIDGEELLITTHAATVGELLEEQNIDLSKNDKLSHNENTKISRDMEILIVKSKKVTINIDGKEQTYESTHKTIKDLLIVNGIQVGVHDSVTPGIFKVIEDDMTITINKAKQVNIQTLEGNRSVWSLGETVEDVIKETKLPIGPLDRIEPILTTKIKNDLTIQHIKVEQNNIVEKETTNFEVIRKDDANLSKGKEKVIQKGMNGSIQKHYKVTYENGIEINRELLKSEILNKPQNKIIHVGTKKVSTQAAPSGGGRELYVTATAYTAYCNGCSGTTATGINLRANSDLKVIAVDPRLIPLGSKVWVEGYGVAIAGDTGGAIKGNKIDLFMPTKKQAYNFGRKTVKIKVY